LHQLQGDGPAPSVKPQREEIRERPERDERPRFRNDRPDHSADRGHRSGFADRREKHSRREDHARRSEPPVPHPVRPKPPQRAESENAVPAPAPLKSQGDKLGANLELPKAVSKPKTTFRTPADQTRLWMNLGKTAGVVPIDVVNAVAGLTGLPGKVVGTVEIRERHLFVNVASEHANGIVAKLNRAEIKGQKVKVKLA
jgi:ATP-dependent RNA helicase DeaD